MKIRFPLPVTTRLRPPILSAIVALTLPACTSPRPLKGGKAITTPKPAGGVEQTLAQGENPSAASRQNQETIKVRTYTLPAGTRIEQSPLPTAQPISSHSSHPSHFSHSAAAPPALHSGPSPSTISYQLSTPVLVTEREETHAKTELGAAQKDAARELGAKLSSLKSIVWVGLALFVFGLASLFWYPLKTVIGSVTTSAAVTLGGLALMVLPTLVVGNELFILGDVVLIAGAWFLAHRHGHLRGKIDSITTHPSIHPPINRDPSINLPFPPRTPANPNPNPRAQRRRSDHL